MTHREKNEVGKRERKGWWQGEILNKERAVTEGKSVPGRGISKGEAPELNTAVCWRNHEGAGAVAGD